MIKILNLVFLIAVSTAVVQGETVPQPHDEGVRYTIRIPEGGLASFLGWQRNRLPLISHHRAGPVPGYPENAIETMDNALKYGPGLMEVDVAELADGTLVLMHDRTFDRTTTGRGSVSDLGWNTVKAFYLKDENQLVTSFRVPRLDDVLGWTKGRAILTLDIKPDTDFKKVVDAVEKAGAQDYVAAIAYSLEQAVFFHKVAPGMPITVTVRNDADIQAVLASGIPARQVVAWTGTSVLSSAFYQKLHGNGWRVIMGTLGGGADAIDKQIAANDNDARYLELYQLGIDVIATDRFWAVQNQIRNPNLYFFVREQHSVAQ